MMKKENTNNITNIKICNGDDFAITDDIIVSSPMVIAQSIRVHLQNSRQGTVGCKGRAELTSRSNKKPWRQKGTGRARSGTPRSPLWRGGAVCFGPQMRSRKLFISKKMNKSALKYLFLDLLDTQKIISIKTNFSVYSTKKAQEFLIENQLNTKKILFLYDNSDFEAYYSFSNIKNVTMLSFDSIYPYAIANDSYILYLEKNETQFKEMVNKWLQV